MNTNLSMYAETSRIQQELQVSLGLKGQSHEIYVVCHPAERLQHEQQPQHVRRDLQDPAGASGQSGLKGLVS